MAPLFFISISTQFENLGDALINRELILLAAEHGEVIVDWSRCPKSFRQTLDLTNEQNVRILDSRFAFFHSMLAARGRGRRCVMLFKPGAYFGSSGLSRRRAACVLGMHKLLQALGVEQMLFGASYERLDVTNRKFLVRKSEFLTRHFVRDKQSLEYARSLGIESQWNSARSSVCIVSRSTASTCCSNVSPDPRI